MPKTIPSRLRAIARLTLPLALVATLTTGLSGCAEPFDASVSRFHRELPVPAGQTFSVVAENPRNAGGLEFGMYAGLVAQQLRRVGYVQGDPATSDLVVEFDYGIDKGRDKFGMGSIGPAWGPWGGFAGGYGGGWGYGGGLGYGGGWGYGLYDPWINDVDVTTVYTSSAELIIKRRSDNRRVFEGRAKAVSQSDRLDYVVPKLVEALFAGFPGHSGETVHISIAPEKKK